MEHPCFVFVPPEHLDELQEEHAVVIEWALSHWHHPNVLVLTEEDVYLLQYQSQVLDIINQENDSMLQWGEDDWVIDRQTKGRLQHRLAQYAQKLPASREQQIVNDLLRLLAIAQRTNKYLYFNF
jgi:hypothetical protein